MSSLMMMDMGVTAAAGVAGIAINFQQMKTQKLLTEHSNRMAAISAQVSNNRLARNAAEVRGQVVLADAADQITAMQDQGAATVAAAVTGAEGASVDATMHGFARSAAQRKYARQRSAETAKLQIEDQRRDVALQKAMGTKSTVMPNTMMLDLLGLGTSLLDVYKQHTPGSHQKDK